MAGFLNNPKTLLPKPPTDALNFLKDIQEKELEKSIFKSPKRLNFSPSKIIKGQSIVIQHQSNRDS
jgi:hypothetical protein